MITGNKAIYWGLILLLLSNTIFAKEKSYPLIDALDIESDLKSAILKEEFGAKQLESALNTGCTKLSESGVIHFIENQLSPLIKERPKYCEFIKVRKFQKDIAVNMPFKDSSKITIERKFKIDFEEVYFDESLISKLGRPTSASDKFILKTLIINRGKSLSRPLPYEEQSKQDLEDYEKKYIDAYRSGGNADPLLKQTLLLRIWPELSSLEQMKIHRECSNDHDMQLNNHRAFWSFNNQEKPENRQLLEMALKICNTEKTEDLIPFIDESILSEYSYYLQGLSHTSKSLFDLCSSWPIATFNNATTLPSTNRKSVLFNFAEFQFSEFYVSDGEAVRFFNTKFNVAISQEELTAIQSYTGDSFDPINAYEQWGKIGLYMATRERQIKLRKNKEDTYTEPNYKDFKSLEDYKKAYNTYQLNLKIGEIPYNWESMSPGEKAKYIRDTTINYNESIQGADIPELAENLKSALKKMDNFNGVTFGGHQLKTHLFTRLREGSTFTPGFFMSTSTNMNTAKGFLKITDGESEENPEEKSGYLFVIKNETGTPINNLSLYQEEFEVLINPDSQFKILEIAPFEDNGTVYPNVSIIYIQEVKE